ncbi:MAG: peptide chain release factor N(5)-glutamine methyltransferase [Clostridiales bacterium]|nr:peptide chain release factor N(5)-glutamine methyltransferase [Clostridiales bacterium]
MTYRKICGILSEAGIAGAEHEAALLIERFCSISPAMLPLLKDKEFSCPELESAVMRRAERYPLQYILGEWGFCREKYKLNPDCLIPRADTELLVETAARLIPPGGSFIDAGTGCGCIAISLLAARPDITGCAFDISAGALETARSNAETNRVSGRLKLLQGDMLDTRFFQRVGVFDAVISNPPYIPSGEITGLEPELCFEPRIALDGGADGLTFYRGLISNAGLSLRADGVIILEIGSNQAAQVIEIAGSAGYSCMEILKDIEGRDRVLVLGRLRR